MRAARAAVLALPAVALGVAGLFHPMHLTYATSTTWWLLHVPGLFAFPLVGVVLMVLFRGRRDAVAVVAVRLRALPAVAMVPGAYLVHAFHIFAPEGVAGMLLVGLSIAWVGYLTQDQTGRTSTTAARSMGP